MIDVSAKRVIMVLTLALASLYLTIWPHEVGHGLTAYLYGCKANWWQTNTSWYLWSSWEGAIDYDCLQARGRLAIGLEAFGGIMVNFVLLALAPVVGRWWRVRPETHETTVPWLFLASFFWALANYAEAFSYLVLNTAWLKSDMETVVVESGLNRWLWFTCGCVAGTLVASWLLLPAARKAAAILTTPGGSPRAWIRRFAIFVIIVSTVMALARIVLTRPGS